MWLKAENSLRPGKYSCVLHGFKMKINSDGLSLGKAVPGGGEWERKRNACNL